MISTSHAQPPEAPLKVACGFDHAGVPLRGAVLRAVAESGAEPIDLGTDHTDPIDYPDVAIAVARSVLSGDADRGVIVCGSGAGVAVAATKVPGIRAAVIHDTYTAHQAVEHDDVNALCLGARVIGPELAAELVRAYLRAGYTGEERHRRRLAKIDAIEHEGLAASVAAAAGEQP